MVDKIDAAFTVNDNDHRNAALNEGKGFLMDRNKHILLAEKYGWDTVECYAAEPLASDAENEKRIKKAVKESKRSRDEKKRKRLPQMRSKRATPCLNRPQPEQKVVFDRA